MRHKLLEGIAIASVVLLSGCGGGSSDAGMQGSTGATGTAPVTPVTPVVPVTPAPTPDPGPGPVTNPDFTAYLAKMAATAESAEPVDMSDIEFTFNDEEDDTVFATLFESL